MGRKLLDFGALRLNFALSNSFKTKNMKFNIFKTRKPATARKIFNLDIEYISLVDQPANNLPVIIKGRDGLTGTAQLNGIVVSKNAEKGIVYATVYEPGKVDLQKDFSDEVEIERAAHNFLKKNRQHNVDVMHDMKKQADTTVVESFILKGTNPNYPNIAEGSWCVAIQLGEQLKKNIDSIKGVSMYGRAEAEEDVPVVQKGNAVWLRTLRVEAGVGDTVMAEALGVDLDQYASIESGTDDYEFTAESLKQIAKVTKKPIEVIAVAAANGILPASDQTANDTPPQDAPPAEPASKQVDKNLIKEQKKMIKSKTGTITTSPSKIADSSAENRALLFKSMLKLRDENDVPIAKGQMEAGIADFEGTLQPVLRTEVITLIGENSGVLKQAQVVEMSSLSEDVPILGVAARQLRRYGARTVVADGKLVTADSLTRRLLAQDADTVYNLADSIRNNYQGRIPQLESIIGQGLFGQHGNDLEDLAFNGITDTYDKDASEPMLTLGVGYLTLARDGVDSWGIVNPDDEDDTDLISLWSVAIKRMAANNPKYAKNAAFICGPADFEQYEEELTFHPGGMGTLVEGAKGMFRGHPVFVVPSLAQGDWLYTPVKNLIFGIVTQGTSGTRVKSMPTLKGTDYLLTSAVDMDFVDINGVVVSVQPS
jgi:hypothetical protein